MKQTIIQLFERKTIKDDKTFYQTCTEMSFLLTFFRNI